MTDIIMAINDNIVSIKIFPFQSSKSLFFFQTNMDFKSKQQTIENVHFSLDKKTIVNIIYVEKKGGNV